MKLRKRILFGLAALCLLLCVLGGCGVSGREYNDDIIVELTDREGTLVIREWSFLLGSGAEVYYDYGWRSPILLGQTSGADDGYCPFEEGAYRITRDGEAVTLSWRATDAGTWRSATFDLPDEAVLKRQSVAIIAVAAVAVLALGAGVVLAVCRRRRKR